MKNIKHEITINTSKEIVWWAWTLCDRVAQWFAPSANVEAKLDGAYELFFIPNNPDQMSTKGCKITQFDPQTKLSFTWKGPDDFASLMNHDEALTTVQVTLSEEGEECTKVTIEHTGWGDGPEWEKAIAWHQMAWNQVLNSLKSSIESGLGELCCTPE